MPPMKTHKSERTIKKELRDLRKFIDSGKGDPLAIRIAYAVETAMRWVLEDTVGWKTPVEDSKDNAEIYKKSCNSRKGSR